MRRLAGSSVRGCLLPYFLEHKRGRFHNFLSRSLINVQRGVVELGVGEIHVEEKMRKKTLVAAGLLDNFVRLGIREAGGIHDVPGARFVRAHDPQVQRAGMILE